MTLELTIKHTIEPREVWDLVFGTGALRWEWWHGAQWVRGGMPVNAEIDNSHLESDYVVIQHEPDDSDDPPIGETKLALDAIVDAVETALKEKRLTIDATHLAEEGLGYMDADDADIVLQLAVYSDTIFG